MKNLFKNANTDQKFNRLVACTLSASVLAQKKSILISKINAKTKSVEKHSGTNSEQYKMLADLKPVLEAVMADELKTQVEIAQEACASVLEDDELELLFNAYKKGVEEMNPAIAQVVYTDWLKTNTNLSNAQIDDFALNLLASIGANVRKYANKSGRLVGAKGKKVFACAFVRTIADKCNVLGLISAENPGKAFKAQTKLCGKHLTKTVENLAVMLKQDPLYFGVSEDDVAFIIEMDELKKAEKAFRAGK